MDIHEARKFIEAIEIEKPRTYRSSSAVADTSQTGEPRYHDASQVLVIGSQIAEFEASVPTSMRPYISNSFLLAQLAARKAVSKSNGGPASWFDAYLGVLTSIGWVQEDIATSKHEVSGDSLQAQKEVIAVIEAALGPAVAPASIVLAALNGLKEVSKDSPWITLFDRQSQTRTVQQFQMAYVRSSDAKMPQINLAYFELSADASVSQVLFFKFSSSSATLVHQETSVSLNQNFFDALKDDIEKRVASHISGLIQNIEI